MMCGSSLLGVEFKEFDAAGQNQVTAHRCQPMPSYFTDDGATVPPKQKRFVDVLSVLDMGFFPFCIVRQIISTESALRQRLVVHPHLTEREASQSRGIADWAMG